MGYDYLTLGERLKVARGRCGLTKAAVARIVLDPGMDKKPRSATIGGWEQGTMPLTLPSLRRLADLYDKVGGVSPSWVVLGDGLIMKPDLEETLPAPVSETHAELFWHSPTLMSGWILEIFLKRAEIFLGLPGRVRRED